MWLRTICINSLDKSKAKCGCHSTQHRIRKPTKRRLRAENSFLFPFVVVFVPTAGLPERSPPLPLACTILPTWQNWCPCVLYSGAIVADILIALILQPQLAELAL
jgi:hypothetical protein